MIIYNSSLITTIFKDDNRKVENILAPMIMDTYEFGGGGRKFT